MPSLRNKSKPGIVFILICFVFLLFACSGNNGDLPTEIRTPDAEEVISESTGSEEQKLAEEYCIGLGYTLGNGQDELCDSYRACKFPDKTDCRVEEFYKGRCGQDFTYCQQQGNKIQSWGANPRCNFPDGSFCPEGEFFSGECEAGQIFP